MKSLKKLCSTGIATICILLFFVGGVAVAVDCSFATFANVVNISTDCVPVDPGCIGTNCDNRKYSAFIVNASDFFQGTTYVYGTPLSSPRKKLTVEATKLRHFKVLPYKTLVLENLELSGAELFSSSDSGNGGAIYLDEHSQLFAKNVRFHGNKAHLSGSAVYMDKLSFFNCTHCVFSHNFIRSTSESVSPVQSGAIGGAKVEGIFLNFCHLYANNGRKKKGGAIGVTLYFLASNMYGQGNRFNRGLVVENTIFDSNVARNGGAVFTRESSSIVFRNCTFHKNNATNGDGGALFIDNGVSGGDFLIVDTVFSNNHALGGHGGAIAMARTASFVRPSKDTLQYAPAQIHFCKLEKNHASQSGGALSIVIPTIGESGEPPQSVEILNSTIEFNSALGENGGGGVYVRRDDKDTSLELKTINSLLLSNNARNSHGGGVSIVNGKGDFQNTQFLNNVALKNGSSVVGQASQLLFFECKITSLNNDGGPAVIKSDEIFTLINAKVFPASGWSNYDMTAKCHTPGVVRCDTYGDFNFANCLDDTYENVVMPGLQCGCSDPGCALTLEPELAGIVEFPTESRFSSSILGPYYLKEGIDNVQYRIRLQSTPTRPVRICVDARAVPQRSSLELNIFPNCVVISSKNDRPVFTLNVSNDHIDAFVDYQNYILVNYVHSTNDIFYKSALISNVTVVARLFDENEAGVEVVPTGDLSISLDSKFSIFKMRLKTKPLLQSRLIATITPVDYYDATIVEGNGKVWNMENGALHFNISAEEIMFNVSLNLNTTSPPPQSTLSIYFGSSADKNYREISTVKKLIYWDAAVPIIERVSSEGGDRILVVEWSSKEVFFDVEHSKNKNFEPAIRIQKLAASNCSIDAPKPLSQEVIYVRVRQHGGRGEWASTEKWLVDSDCDENKFLKHHDPNMQKWQCEPCPEGASCEGNVPVAMSGWWSVSWESNVFRKCLRHASCPQKQECAPFHTGTLCAACLPGAYRDRATYECYECGVVWINRIGLLVMILLGSMVAAAVVRVTLLSGGEDGAIDIKIAQITLNHFLIVSVASDFPLEWPPFVTDFLRVFSYLTFSSLGDSGGFGVDCGLRIFGNGSKLTWAVFIVFLAILGLIAWSTFWWIVYRCTSKSKTVEFQTSILVTLFLFHPPISKAALQLLACRTVADRHFLEADFNVDCQGKEHMPYKIWASVILSLFTFGIPLFYYFKIRLNSQIFRLSRYNSEASFKRREVNSRRVKLEKDKCIYGYLYSGFVGRAWYWEIWNSVRKFLITACSVLFQSWGVSMQTWSALGLMAFFLALFIHVQPYCNPVLNRLETYALFVDFTTLFLGLGLFNNANAGEMKSESFSHIFSTMVVAVNVVFVLYLFYVVKRHSEYIKKGKSLVASICKRRDKPEEMWTVNPLERVKTRRSVELATQPSENSN